MSDRKIFDDFPKVDCNYCERYYLNQCDGAKIGDKALKRPCKQFLPTRELDMPREIKSLKTANKRLTAGFMILVVLQLLQLMLSIMGVI